MIKKKKKIKPISSLILKKRYYIYNYRKDFLKTYAVRGKETQGIVNSDVPRAYVKLTSIFTGTVNFTTICTRGNSSSRATSDRSRKKLQQKGGSVWGEREEEEEENRYRWPRHVAWRKNPWSQAHARAYLHLAFASIHDEITKNLSTNSRNNLSIRVLSLRLKKQSMFYDNKRFLIGTNSTHRWIERRYISVK